jgi:hypothetical protein
MQCSASNIGLFLVETLAGILNLRVPGQRFRFESMQSADVENSIQKGAGA